MKQPTHTVEQHRTTQRNKDGHENIRDKHVINTDYINRA